MRLVSYKFSETNSWNFSKVYFQRLNLIVGRTGSGKTRFVNTINNFSKLFCGQQELNDGCWEIEFTLPPHRQTFFYLLNIKNKKVTRELLLQEENVLLEKTSKHLRVQGKSIEGLSNQIIGLTAFQQNKILKRIADAFKCVFMRRHNPGSSGNSQFFFLSLSALAATDNPVEFTNNLRIQNIINPELGFFYLQRHKKEQFKELRKIFLSSFPCAQDLAFKNIKELKNKVKIQVEGGIDLDFHCICVKENNAWIPRIEISSGMNRFLEALIDIFVSPPNSIVIYDEFENGLDPVIIGDLIELYMDHIEDRQYIFTSHHPYIINNIHPENWIVFNRKQYKVQNFSGRKIEKDSEIGGYFTSLLNDKFFQGESS